MLIYVHVLYYMQAITHTVVTSSTGEMDRISTTHACLSLCYCAEEVDKIRSCDFPDWNEIGSMPLAVLFYPCGIAMSAAIQDAGHFQGILIIPLPCRLDCIYLFCYIKYSG